MTPEPDIVACFDSIETALHAVELAILDHMRSSRIATMDLMERLDVRIKNLSADIATACDGVEVAINYLGPRGPHT